MKERVAKTSLSFVNGEQPIIFNNRLSYAAKYMELAMEAVSNAGRESGDIASFEYGSLSGDSSQSTIDRINEGDLLGLALMDVDFKLLACVADREDLIKKAPLSVVVNKGSINIKLV